MRNATPLRRTLPALLATTLLAGGLLLGQTAAADTATAAPRITCDINKLRTDARKERDRALQLKRLGATEEARRAFARAEALEKRAKQCADADRDHKPPLWG